MTSPGAAASGRSPAPPKQVGYLVHQAGRTGATIVLLRLVRAMSAAGYVAPRFILRSPGALLAEFEQLGPVLVMPETRLSRAMRSAGGGLGPAAIGTARRGRARRFLRDVELLYSNTVVNGELLAEVDESRIAVVTHVHELPRYLTEWTTMQAIARLARRTSAWISVSDAVTRMLVEQWRVPATSVTLIRECVDDEILNHIADRARGNAQLGVTDRDLVVGCAGTLDARKGLDLFPVLAKLLMGTASDRPLAFRWLGGEEGSPEQVFAREEVRLAGLEDRMRYVAELADPRDAIARFDVLAILSREDPYPLVAVEAAALGRPIVCFAGAGGAPELASRGAGAVVGYLDVQAMAQAVLDVLNEGANARTSTCRALAMEHRAVTAAEQVRDVFGSLGR